jgi:hypothetical protein
MNIINKLLLLLSLSMSPVVTVSAQTVNDEFDTFQSAEKYLEDFDYLTENSYRLSFSKNNNEIDYSSEFYTYYVIPNYYDFEILFVSSFIYYQNDNYNFYTFTYRLNETLINYSVDNYIGSEIEMPFLALDYIGMSQVIEHDKMEKSNSISIYNSFYNFFTGFFPEYVVNEYHGIFTFIVVGFLLFLVFGFVFFLFRVIRRLVGFK